MPEPILLKTKLSPYALSARLVVRTRLIESLANAPDSCLILVSAPAGYGKTTVMRALCERWAESQCQTAWVSLDTGDNDPARFAAYLMAAFNQMLPKVFPQAGWVTKNLESTVIHIVNRLVECGPTSALILDDYHLITAQPVHSAINLLLENLPPGFKLVIGSRGDPPLQLSRLRVRQRLVELRAADLRFTREEVSEFCEKTLGVKPSTQSASLLEAGTEGWAAGLQLALALITQRHTLPDDRAISMLATQLSGSDFAVFDYLADEVFSQQPEAIQQFLLYTSILTRFNAELCDVLTGHTHLPLELHDLDRANLFVTPIDGSNGWYRYHHLFGSFLQTRLAQTQPERVRGLHQAAASWFANHGDTAEAMEHALAGEDFDLAARLFAEDAWEPLMSRGELMTLLRWAQAFPDNTYHQRPRLALFASQVFTQAGHHQRATHLLDMAEQRLENSDPANPRTQADRGILAAYHSLVAITAGHPHLALEQSRRAAELIPAEDRLVAIQLERTNGFIHYNLGNMQAAVDALQAAMRHSHEMDQHYWLLESAHWLILSFIKMGALKRAASACRDLEGTYPPDFGPLACVLAPHGIVATELNQLGEAESLFRRSIDMSRREKLMDALWISCVGLARVHLFRGEFGPVASLLDEGMRAAKAIGNKVVLSIAGTINARLALARGELDQARAWVESYLSERPTEYPAELEDLTVARVWITLGETERAMNLLNGMLEPVRESGRNARLIEAQILRAAIFERLRRPGEADTALEEALSLGEPEGYLRTFIDHMPLIDESLRRVEPHFPTTFQRIWAGVKSDRTRISDISLDALTEREVEVLRLLARGASNQEIAGSLVIGVGTVKSHMNHIMSKLDARNRTEAVAVARSDGLID